MKVKTIRLDDPTGTTRQDKASAARPNANRIAWVIDNALTPEFLEMVDDFRNSLPLDTKRPTVKRRFFSSAKQCPAIREGLLEAIQSVVSMPFVENGVTDTTEFSIGKSTPTQTFRETHGNDPNDTFNVRILAYMRFLEYDEVGGRLDPHTDGNKVCEDTNIQSTHTMLLYLRDCRTGGATVLLEKDNDNKWRVVEAVQPMRGRILLFPHPTLHEGAATVDVPKICLRSEVALT